MVLSLKFNLIALAVLAVCCCSSIARAADKECDLAKSAIVAASELRGLRIKRTVPCFVQDKESVKSHIIALVNEKTPLEKLRLEGIAYKTVGLIPESFDYEHGLIDLYVSQLGGYYDPSHKHFVMAGWMPAAFQTTIAVHELTHALQDQYFDLEKFMDPKLENSDLLMARSGLVEGDATAIMLDYAKRLMGQPGIAADPNVESVMLQNVIGSGLSASVAGVPQSLQLTLLFPYTSGLRFAHTLLRKNGYRSIDDAFRSSPRSTEEILHPEKYLAHQADFKVFSDGDVMGETPGSIVYRDTLGEFVISALIGMFEADKSKVVEASVGWGGDRVVMVENEGKYTLHWRTAWDTEQDAEQFLAVYQPVLEKRYPGQIGSTVTINKNSKEVSISITRDKL